MATWHQQKAGILQLAHATKWSSYNSKGHLSVMRFESKEQCMIYCNKTGDIPVAPLSL
jgi:hypothetical protein